MSNYFRASFIALALFSGSSISIAQVSNMVCNFALEYEYFPDVVPQLTKSCKEMGGPLESCSSFSFHAIGHPKKFAYSDAMAGIPKENGILAFKPVGLSSFEEKIKGMNTRTWVLGFIDNSGSPSRAEEKFIVIDGAFKPITKLLSYAEKQAFFKNRKNIVVELSDESMSCKPSKKK